MKRSVAACALALGIRILHAQEPGAAFLTLPHSVRSEGAGGSAGLALGAEALGLNPALLSPSSSQGQLYTSFAQLWEDTTYAHLAGAWRVGKQHTGLGIALSTVKTDGNRDRNAQGTLTGTTSDSQDTTAMVGMSLRPSVPWRVGGTVRLFRSEIGNYQSDTAWSTDWGAAWSARKTLIAFSINHLGPGQQFINQQDPLPTALRADGSWTTTHFTWVLGASQEIAAARTRLSGGLEYRWGPLALRSGLNTHWGGEQESTDDSSTEDWLSGLSAGVGVHAGKSLRFDYAVRQPSSHFDVIHRASLSWSWGPAPQPFNRAKPKGKKTVPKGSTPPPARPRLKL
ncbi:MAG: hypothetical protein IPN19_14210 [Elusimicrobia bacterium]|nr:hypothetical protein [Elusimicrobiota bacterium]